MTKPDTVGGIGERELIRRLRPYVVIGAGPDNLFGVGDDCGIMAPPSGERLIMTTDLLVEGTHFLRTDDSAWLGIGRKAAGANISDIAAMGARPAAMLVSLALPPDLPVEALLNFYRGMHEYGRKYSAPVIGGDTTRGDHVCISITALGWKSATSADCLRSSAKPGDNLFVTGALGASRAAVELILRPEVHVKVSDELAEKLLARHFAPQPRVDVGLALASNFSRVACIDISDSLYNEASLLAEASGIELTLNIDGIPVDENARQYCAAIATDPSTYALYSGEEYELLFAAPVSINELSDKFSAAGVTCTVTQVGTVNPGSGVKLLKGGHPVDPQDETYVHFT